MLTTDFVAGRLPPPFVPPHEPAEDITAQLLADGLAAAMLEPPPVDAAAQVQFGEVAPMHWIGSELNAEATAAGEEGGDAAILRLLGASQESVRAASDAQRRSLSPAHYPQLIGELAPSWGTWESPACSPVVKRRQ